MTLLFTEPSYLDNHYLAAKDEYEEMVSFVGFKEGAKVIDAGCGCGSYISILSSKVGKTGEIHAVDISKNNIYIVEYLIKKQISTCPTFVNHFDIKNMDFADDSFDAVWCSNVFQYLNDEEKEQAVLEFKRVVRPGGIIAIKEVDITISYLGLNPSVFGRIIEKSSSSIQFQSTLKTNKLISHYKKIGLKRVKYKTFNVEWMHPLESLALPYLDSIISSFGALVKEFDLSKSDLNTINKLFNQKSKDYYLRSPDFYWREGFAVAVYRV